MEHVICVRSDKQPALSVPEVCGARIHSLAAAEVVENLKSLLESLFESEQPNQMIIQAVFGSRYFRALYEAALALNSDIACTFVGESYFDLRGQESELLAQSSRLQAINQLTTEKFRECRLLLARLELNGKELVVLQLNMSSRDTLSGFLQGLDEQCDNNYIAEVLREYLFSLKYEKTSLIVENADGFAKVARCCCDLRSLVSADAGIAALVAAYEEALVGNAQRGQKPRPPAGAVQTTALPERTPMSNGRSNAAQPPTVYLDTQEQILQLHAMLSAGLQTNECSAESAFAQARALQLQLRACIKSGEATMAALWDRLLQLRQAVSQGRSNSVHQMLGAYERQIRLKYEKQYLHNVQELLSQYEE